MILMKKYVIKIFKNDILIKFIFIITGINFCNKSAAVIQKTKLPIKPSYVFLGDIFEK